VNQDSGPVENSPRPIRLRSRIGAVVAFLALLWILEALDQAILHGSLDGFGIRPRQASGLWGLALAPFLHGGFLHLMANSVPFLVLGSLVALRGMSELVEVTLTVMVLGGLGTWIFGEARSVHIGASALVFGYFGFLVTVGVIERRLLSMAVALVVTLFYGGLVWGILPSGSGLSWEGHLFGLLAGAAYAWLLSRWGRSAASDAMDRGPPS
jgi:membrane associated rhomboid family serine protease